ncbi:MAG: MoaD/ThiS family protein [Armatimonadota bacterium]|nr:MoaD/ThiS family protein [Armatimonadota bacterium]
MRVTLLLFGPLREKAARASLMLELSAGATAVDALQRAARLAGLPGEWLAGVRLARNGEYCEPDTPLEEGDEVALLPPVSGG